MPVPSARITQLAAIPNVTVLTEIPLAAYTRFGLGGPAAVFCDTSDASAFLEVLGLARRGAVPHVVIGGGSNLVVSDSGFDGAVLRFTGSQMLRDATTLTIEAGAMLQDVVDQSIAWGLAGMEAMTGIPGYLGGAIYGNAGAYGESIHERVARVRFTDGARVITFTNEECRFRYRQSVFKEHKEWIILSADLRFAEGNAAELRRRADDIREIRDAKYPPSMKCAGSIFKNQLVAQLPPFVLAEVPPSVVREGKIPSAWFLEQVGAKGLRRGDIQVATYHANLIYNDGSGKAADVVSLIQDLKSRVRDRFGFDLEEEVQFVGFEVAAAPA